MVKIIAQRGSDKIEVEVLDDGNLKISTDRISMPNHGSAEILVRELLSGAGGEVNRVRKGLWHHHSHDQADHVHE